MTPQIRYHGSPRRSPLAFAHAARRRVRPRLLPIAQTAVAAVAAWYLAALVLPVETPTFASIAAVICLGATYGQRPQRAVELIGGVMLGIVVASGLLLAIGTGPLQLGVLVVLAMGAASLIRGGELFVNEAAISAILLVSLQEAAGGFSADRIAEGLIGGGVALAVASLLFPPHPAELAGGEAQPLLGRLARALEETAGALRTGDPDRAEAALAASRELDSGVSALRDAIDVAVQTARLAPPRRGERGLLRRYEAAFPQLDFAVRNTRVLTRHALRYTRSRLPAPDGLPEAIEGLAGAVWALGAQFERPERGPELREQALAAAARATELFAREPDLALTEILVQVRSVAVDLVRAAELLTPEQPEDGMAGRSTEELLLPAPAG